MVLGDRTALRGNFDIALESKNRFHERYKEYCINGQDDGLQ